MTRSALIGIVVMFLQSQAPPGPVADLTAVPIVTGASATGLYHRDVVQRTTAQEVAVQPQPATIEGAVSRVYKSVEGVDLRLHIFNPPKHVAAAGVPAIVFFFGGAWTSGTVTQFVPQSKYFASRGMVAVVADYRVFSRPHDRLRGDRGRQVRDSLGAVACA